MSSSDTNNAIDAFKTAVRTGSATKGKNALKSRNRYRLLNLAMAMKKGGKKEHSLRSGSLANNCSGVSRGGCAG